MLAEAFGLLDDVAFHLDELAAANSQSTGRFLIRGQPAGPVLDNT